MYFLQRRVFLKLNTIGVKYNKGSHKLGITLKVAWTQFNITGC